MAERRITSVLFGDLVGFTPLSESRDAEDVRELLSQYFETARTLIERYGGVVEKFIGDAVMAVWGVPAAHEDDAERAVRSALELVDAVSLLGEEIGLPGLAMRVGIVTGEVAVTLGATGQGMVAGDAVNTAARVQAAAAPGQVWVDDTTRAATAGAVAFTDMGSHALKGKADPVALFAARAVVAAPGGGRRVDGLEAPFVGRDRELRLTKELFHAALEEDRPRLVTVFGPAGVGKTRLAWEFDKYVDGITNIVHWHRGRCLSYGDGLAFWALADMVRGRLGILEGDQSDVVIARLVDGMTLHVPDADERAWLLPRVATLIGVGDAISPGTSFARDDLFAAWRTLFERIARSEGCVGAYLQIDDLQWADQALLDFLGHVLDTAKAPIFILGLARSELTDRVPGFGTGRRATAIHLEPLSRASMESVVDGLVDGLPGQVRAALVERSEGVPLFAVETVRGLIDRDVVVPREGRYVLDPEAADLLDIEKLELPTTLHTLIAARLDALPGQQRRLVQDASVLGQVFTVEGVVALVRALEDDVDVSAELADLVRKEIFAVEADPRSPERGQYRFVQALVRSVAYETLARRDRKARHLAVARHLADEPDSDAVPSVLASHYLDAYAAAADDPDAAELATQALVLLADAAVRARSLGAPEEARRHLVTALTLATADVERARLLEEMARVELMVGRADSAAVSAGQAQALYSAADRELDAWRAQALWGEAQISAGNGQVVTEPLAATYAIAEKRFDAARVAAELALHCGRSHSVSRGDTAASIPWYDRAVQLAESVEDLALLSRTLSSYGAACMSVGRPNMGLGLLRVSLDLARGLDDPITRVNPLNNLVAFLSTRDLAAAKVFADEGLAIVNRLGDRDTGVVLASSTVHLYWLSGDWDEAMQLHAQLSEGVGHNMYTHAMKSYTDLIAACRGEPVEPLTGVEAAGGELPDPMLGSAQARLTAAVLRDAGDLTQAAELTRRSATTWVDFAGIDDDFVTIWLVAIDDALAVGDAIHAAELFGLATSHPMAHAPRLIRCHIPRVRALINAATGRHDDVDADFVTATAALRDFGAPYWLGRVLLDHAEWLVGQGRAAEAAPLADEAATFFETLRATPWIERARAAVPTSEPIAVDS